MQIFGIAQLLPAPGSERGRTVAGAGRDDLGKALDLGAALRAVSIASAADRHQQPKRRSDVHIFAYLTLVESLDRLLSTSDVPPREPRPR